MKIQSRLVRDSLIEDISGKYAVCIDSNSSYFGWVFSKHPDGQWVTLRKATEIELNLSLGISKI